jgi:hypothetical protein
MSIARVLKFEELARNFCNQDSTVEMTVPDNVKDFKNAINSEKLKDVLCLLTIYIFDEDISRDVNETLDAFKSSIDSKINIELIRKV